MIVAAMLLCRIPMSFRSLLVSIGRLLVHILRHSASLLFGESSKQRLKLSMVPTPIQI